MVSRILTGFILCAWMVTVAQAADFPRASLAFSNEVHSAWEQLPAARRHYIGTSEAQIRQERAAAAQYELLLREKVENRWFAALVALDEGRQHEIMRRFAEWREFAQFLEASEPLVEAWEPATDGSALGRRLTAYDLAQRSRESREWPSIITLRWQDAAANQTAHARVEFGFSAARRAREAHAGYLAHRRLQRSVHDILNVRDSQGRLNAAVQTGALERALTDGSLRLTEQPIPVSGAAAAAGASAGSLFAGVEFEVDEFGNFLRAVRFYRASEIRPRVVPVDGAGGVAGLRLGAASATGKATGNERVALGFVEHGVSGELRLATNTVAGQDAIQIRVKDSAVADPRRWNVIEFGEGALLQNRALAEFSLIQAHIDLAKKRLAVKKSKLDLYVEPVVAAINIGTGIAGVGFPVGDAVRLAYNLMSPWFIAAVPRPHELKELFSILAAKIAAPDYKTVPGDYLSDESIKHLREKAQKMSEEEIETCLREASDDDLKAMVRLARFQRMDARYSALMNILTSAGKTSGVTEREVWRDIFNSPYFSLAGEINISTIILAASGHKELTVMSGVSLEELAHGDGSASAWAQFFTLSFDIRALANTIAQLSKRTLAEKELERPFPHAPRMDDLAAYEIRAFGFPFLMFHKRRLTLEDAAAYEQDYAYGMIGTRIVERFATKDSMEREIRSGRMAPLGYVRVRQGRRKWAETSLAVFAHRIPEGKHAGKSALIIYGMKAFEDHSAFIARELDRVRQFDQVLRDGGVIEQWLDAGSEGTSDVLSTAASQGNSAGREPVLHAGQAAIDARFSSLLAGLLERRRLARLEQWRGGRDAAESNWAAEVNQRLSAAGVDPAQGDALVAVNPYYSGFVYRSTDAAGRVRPKRLTLIPGFAAMETALRRAGEGEAIEALRHGSLGRGGSGVVLFNAALRDGDRWQIGPLIAGESGSSEGFGVRGGMDAIEKMFATVDQMPVAERLRFARNQYRSTRMMFDANRDGTPEPVFATIEFPPGEDTERKRRDSRTEMEIREIYHQGQLKESIAADIIVRIQRDDLGAEVSSVSRLNRGTLEAPVDGPVIETTRTLELWLHGGNADTDAPGTAPVDGCAPVISKLAVNYLTGRLAAETYGLWREACQVVDSEWITRNEFDANGDWLRAQVFPNLDRTGASTLVPDRVQRLAQSAGASRAGELRFQLTRAPAGADSWLLEGSGARVRPFMLRRQDVPRRLAQTEIFDLAAGGRLVAEGYVEAAEGLGPWRVMTRYEYSDDFFGGRIPSQSFQRIAGAAADLRRTQTLSWQPAQRVLTGETLDSTGATMTQTWRPGAAAPVGVMNSGRESRFDYNASETGFSGSLLSGGDVLRNSRGVYDAANQVWRIEIDRFYAAGVSASQEVEIRSPRGWLVRSQSGGQLESRPVYSVAAEEMGRRVFSRTNPDGPFDRLQFEETDYRWIRGRRQARAKVYLNGAVFDEFEREYDELGRVIVDSARIWPGLNLMTRIEHDGGSDRFTRAVELQNGQPRTVSEPAGLVDRTFLEVRCTPAWGLVSTQRFLIADPLARPLENRYASGDIARPVEWFEATSIARITEKLNRHGRVLERSVRNPSAADYRGLPFDTVERRQASFWGRASVASSAACLRGTGIELWSESAGMRTWFDLRSPHSVPSRTTAVSDGIGALVELETGDRERLVELHFWRTNLVAAAGPGMTNLPSIELTSMDLRGLFRFPVRTRSMSLNGQVLHERSGLTEVPGTGVPTQAVLARAAAATVWQEDLRARFEPGWLVEQTNAATRIRQLRWVPEAPFPGTRAERINDRGFPEWQTSLESIRSADPVDTVGAEVRRHFHKLAENHRELEFNPWLPEREGPWTLWDVADLARDGTVLFRSDRCYAPGGQWVVEMAHKKTGSGGQGAKVAYFVPMPTWSGEVATNSMSGRRRISASLNALNVPALPFSDFIYGYIDCDTDTNSAATATAAAVHVSDSRQRTATFLIRPHAMVETADMSRAWVFSGMNVRWLPDDRLPQLGLVLDAPEELKRKDRVWALAIGDILAAGIDAARIAQIQVEVDSPGNQTVRVSPAYRMSRGSASKTSSFPRDRITEVHRTASGLEVLRTHRRDRSAGEILAGKGVQVFASLRGRPVAVSDTLVNAGHRSLTILDSSDPVRTQPLHAISPDSGYLEHHYRSIHGDAATVYTVVHGFEIPRYEVFRPEILEDEVGPGRLGLGTDYAIQIDVSRRRGALGAAVANVENRLAANVFRNVGENWKQSVFGAVADEGTKLSYSRIQEAPRQAETVQQQPMFAQSLLAGTPVPWQSASAFALAAPAAFDRAERRKLAMTLLRAHVRDFAPRDVGVVFTEPGTGLIATDPGSPVANYADTMREARLIQLAIELGEFGVANDLLEFYRTQTEGGAKPVHDSYEGQSGTATQPAGPYLRPLQSRQSAAAQLAIAEAAFNLGFRTRDAIWLRMGRRLLDGLLANFRPPPTQDGRGIMEFKHIPSRDLLGMKFWPLEPRYHLASNARAYLLLERLSGAEAQNYSLDAAWQAEVRSAAQELGAWLRRHFLSSLQASGVAPMGLLEIQDVQHRTSALAPERWTDPDGWMRLIEAAAILGAATPAQQALWLDNVARVHGVEIDGVWGLDWTPPLMRPAAVSTELTAQFALLAARVGHSNGAAFAAASLARTRTAGGWPLILSERAEAGRLETGLGHLVYAADTNGVRPRWPLTLIGAEPFVLGSDSRPVVARIRPANAGDSEARTARSDLNEFLLIAAGIYLSILVVAFFWWRFRALRPAGGVFGIPDHLVPDPVMQQAEERWAKRVLGLAAPSGTRHTRYSNAAVEMNFHMQFRAIYKLVLEWRRQENGWEPEDPRLVEDETDDWLNGMDEFAAIAGIYMRFVIKAGAKDGPRKSELLKEDEDSNHIWSRLVMYFSEYHWALTGLMRQYNNAVLHQDKAQLYGQITKVLEALGVRQREDGFDARKAFNCPVNPAAFDLLAIQRPGATLEKVFLEAARKLKIPYSHLAEFVRRYKEFKTREEPYPIHPYVIELAKLLPHFLLMALGALVWYNQTVGDRPIVPFLGEVLLSVLGSPWSLLWGGPLVAGMLSAFAASLLRTYRFEERMLSGGTTAMVLDATLTSLFAKKQQAALPQARTGKWWQPKLYERWGWGLRFVGYTGLILALLNHPAPSFVTFLLTKGLLPMIALLEILAIALPLAGSAWSAFLQEQVSRHPGAPAWLQFLNRLNITETRPASPIWLSFKYHYQPSVLSGDWVSMTQSVLVYFLMAGGFFVVGAFLCQEILSLWFTEKYVAGQDWRLVIGGVLFWNTMYLLRYGLFLLLTGVATALNNWPIKTAACAAAACHIGCVALDLPFAGLGSNLGGTGWLIAAALIALSWFEFPLLTFIRQKWPGSAGRLSEQEIEKRLAQIKSDGSATLGVVYMSGDDLSALKLNPALLMSRWQVLRDQLGAPGLKIIENLVGQSADAELESGFKALFDAEAKAAVTLWHPVQLVAEGESPELPLEEGLLIRATTAADRARLLKFWQARRWLVTMMSTAGHAQDTAITLVDTAVRLRQEGLARHTVFYFLQNKYDNNDNNRPSQTPYDKGELAHREKLAGLIEALCPGTSAFSLQNWTPFGFKAGGLTGMDLVHEHTLRLSTMLVLDRNANVHDLDALMDDIKVALTDPDVIIVIPGRGTTNTRTAMGQASQMVEEGHRSFLKGLMGVLGGRASEGVGTGWGNLLACYYGRVQRALVDTAQPRMPLTSRLRRGSSFAVRTEGLIGFTPHAVGISEDTWAVSQTLHNAVALGHRVKFAVSKAIWHKIRETWSHSEWLASFPRWSGGYLQMMHDPIMQIVNDFGPLSVFAKEVRANSGRNFLTAIFALANVLLMPLAIMWDLTPFVQILIVLWNFGFVMNQILTVHGLHAYLEGAGFQRGAAVLGGICAGAASMQFPDSASAASAWTVLGFLLGGFGMGFFRWLYTRVRDVLLFGPQLVLNALGQMIRQTLEFTVSGASPEDAKGVNIAFRAWAGPREDRPQDTYPNLLNLKTVVWLVGLASLIFNVFALSNLDMLNALLLLPSLLFSISIVAGPFLLKPRPGSEAGIWTVVPRVGGWVAAFALAIVVSMMMAAGAYWRLASLAVFGVVFAAIAFQGLRYAGYRRRLQRLTAKLAVLLQHPGIDSAATRKLASQLMPLALAANPPVDPLFESSQIPENQRALAREFLAGPLRKHLRLPVDGPKQSRFAQNRFVSEFYRAFVLALMTFVWLLIVPVPGILVFTAGDLRLSLSLETLLLGLGFVVSLVVVGSWIGLGLEWLSREGILGSGIRPRAAKAYAAFEELGKRPGMVMHPSSPKVCALFTDLATYLDQRSYGYAKQCLDKIELALKECAAPSN